MQAKHKTHARSFSGPELLLLGWQPPHGILLASSLNVRQASPAAATTKYRELVVRFNAQIASMAVPADCCCCL
jgi:hypothetical protein